MFLLSRLVSEPIYGHLVGFIGTGFRSIGSCKGLSKHYIGVLKVKVHHVMFNPLSPNSHQHQFSPDSIRTLSRDAVMRIDKMIAKDKMP